MYGIIKSYSCEYGEADCFCTSMKLADWSRTCLTLGEKYVHLVSLICTALRVRAYRNNQRSVCQTSGEDVTLYKPENTDSILQRTAVVLARIEDTGQNPLLVFWRDVFR